MDYSIRTIEQWDKKALAQWRQLLASEGLRAEPSADYICGIYDDERLIATGCCCGVTLRCFAVDREYQGEGLLNTVLTTLIDERSGRGIYHLFLYTKPKSAKFFGDLGFYEIERVDDAVVFMENRSHGFERFCKDLEKFRLPTTSAAIVMNANPFTLGHRYLVEQAAARYDHVHVFVLSEDASLVPAAVRKRLVLEGTADIANVICHETGPYMISSATFPSYFLKDETDAIVRQAQLDTRVFTHIGAALGLNARCVGEEKTSLVTGIYNEVLAEYLPKAGIDCVIIPRLEKDGAAVSASTVRRLIHDGRLEDIYGLVPESTWNYFSSPEAEPVIRAIQASGQVEHY